MQQNDNKSAAASPLIKYKFLRRTISIYEDSSDTSKLLTYTKMKGLYFRQILEISCQGYHRRRHYLKGKRLVCLKSLDAEMADASYHVDLLKHSKNLKHVSILCPKNTSLEVPTRFIKRLPKNIETVEITSDNSIVDPTQIWNFYKSLTICKKLRRLGKSLKYKRNPAWTETEYEIINQYIPRLSNLRAFHCEEFHAGLQEFQKLRDQGQSCPSITSLKLVVFLQRTQRAPLFFQPLCFPSLRQLNLVGDSLSLDESVIEGFKCLQQLEQLTLEFAPEHKGIEFVLEGLSNLPLLSSFYLSIYDLDDLHKSLLIEFLQKQNQLLRLYLKIYDSEPYFRKQCEEHNRCLEKICQTLNNKEILKRLDFETTSWSIQSLSKGLEHVEGVHQLEELNIRSIHDAGTSSLETSNKVEKALGVSGFCNFIRKQKLSLCRFRIILGLVTEGLVVNSIIEAIAETKKLQLLTIEVNTLSVGGGGPLRDITKDQHPCFSRTILCLEQTLPKLYELEDLSISLLPLTISDNEHLINSSKIFRALPAMKRLKSLTLSLPYLEESVETNPDLLMLLLEVKNLVMIDVKTCGYSNGQDFEEEIEQVQETLMQTEFQRYLRSSLSFYFKPKSFSLT